jgi:hypothetical protein
MLERWRSREQDGRLRRFFRFGGLVRRQAKVGVGLNRDVPNVDLYWGILLWLRFVEQWLFGDV